jgi:glycosyltransferase involved in cell wall biosynthesis
MNRPKVSVAMVAYNHEKYVGQAVESVLSQKAPFDFELVIGEDCSTDSTPSILQSYAAENPCVIKLLLGEKNLGMQWNYARTVEACTGEYLAVLDSDDYWTSDSKLAEQVAFMEQNPSHTISFHRTRIRYEAEPSKVAFLPLHCKSVSDVRDILLGNFIPSCTVMYRRNLIPAFPEWYGVVNPYDWVLHTLVLSGGGTAGFIDQEMADYRVHGGNLFSSLGERKRLDAEMGFYEHITPLLDDALKPFARYGAALRYLDLANHFRRGRQLAEAREALRKALSLETPEHPLPKRRKWRARLRLRV